MDISADITYEYVSRVRYHDDILGIVLKGHLLIEHVLDLMIKKRCNEPKAILNDHRTYSFSVKSRLLYEMNLIPRHTYRNINRINRIRNELAHNLSLDENKIDYKFDRDDEELKGEVELRKAVRNRNNPIKRYLYLLCFGTLSQLQNYYYKEFGIFPLFEGKVDEM